MAATSIEGVGKLLLLALAVIVIASIVAGGLGNRIASAFLAASAGAAFFPCLGLWFVGYGGRTGKKLLFYLGWFLIAMGALFIISKVGEISGLWSV